MRAFFFFYANERFSFFFLIFFFVCVCICAVTEPQKLVYVVFRCSMLYIDFEGRSDGESIKRILSLVNPRNLVSSCPSSIRLRTFYHDIPSQLISISNCTTSSAVDYE